MSVMDIGIKDEKREKVATAIQGVLADTYAVYLKSQNYHWNVEGPRFKSLHELFEEHYTEMRDAIDELAERIRSLGCTARGSFGEFGEMTEIGAPKYGISAEEMVADLLESHEKLVRRLRDAAETAADAGDDGSEDMMIARMQVHEKTAWMLRAINKS